MTTADVKKTDGCDRSAPLTHVSQDNEYLFDVTLAAAIRIKSRDEVTGQRKLAELLDCADVNFGEVDGEPVTGEASLAADPRLVEVNGEAV